jgi:hypothetical protein
MKKNVWGRTQYRDQVDKKKGVFLPLLSETLVKPDEKDPEATIMELDLVKTGQGLISFFATIQGTTITRKN